MAAVVGDELVNCTCMEPPIDKKDCRWSFLDDNDGRYVLTSLLNPREPDSLKVGKDAAFGRTLKIRKCKCDYQ